MGSDIRENPNHMIYIDILRIICSAMVVCIHIASLYIYDAPDTPRWHISNLLDTLSRSCVPIFYMISGGLALSSDHTTDIKYFFTKRVLRLLIPLLCWALLYACFNKIITPGKYDFTSQLINAWQQKPAAHLGFMYQLIMLTLLAPFLRNFVKNSSDQLLWYAVLWGFLGIILPTTLNAVGIPYDLKVYFPLVFGGNIFAYFIGYMLICGKLRINPIICIIGFTIGALVTGIGVYSQSEKAGKLVETFYSYYSMNVILMAVCLFELVRMVVERKSFTMKVLKCIMLLSSLTYGVYYVHMAFVLLINTFIVKRELLPYRIVLPVGYLLTLALSYLISYTLSLIPYVRYLLFGIAQPRRHRQGFFANVSKPSGS